MLYLAPFASSISLSSLLNHIKKKPPSQKKNTVVTGIEKCLVLSGEHQIEIQL